MRSYIHDPDFEADFIESDYEDRDMSLAEKTVVMHEMFMKFQQTKVEDYQADETSAFLRDLKDLLDDAEDDKVFCRESIYLFFKSLLFPVCVEYLKTHQSFAQLCKWRAVQILDVIEEDDTLWDNTKIAVVDFLSLDIVKDL